MWYLITGHTVPKFYNNAGEVVTVALEYDTHKSIVYLNADGELYETKYVSSIAGDLWMITSPEKAVQTLADNGIFPFASKSDARSRAKQLALVGFKYIQVPPIAIITSDCQVAPDTRLLS